MSILKFLSFKATKLENNIIYITFSRTEYLKYVNNKNVLYFFDIPHDVNEENINALIEKNLFLETKKYSNEFYPLSFKYIYKYFLTYNQFYNRLNYLISKYHDISKIEYSSNISFIFTHAVNAICNKYSKTNNPLNEQFDGFSYRHNDEMLSDIPFKIDTHDIFMLLYSMYLRLFNHKIFILPSSFITNLPKSSNILRPSIFSIFDKFKRILSFYRSSKNPAGLLSIKFSNNHNNTHKLDNKIWNDFRLDQIMLIESLLNAFFNKFTPTYLRYLRCKIQKLFRWSKTKCIILDETVDAYRRLISSASEIENIDVEFMPHGILSEKLQFPFTTNDDYLKKYIPKTLAWNKYSSDSLSKMNLKSVPLTFPIDISPHIKDDSRDILVLLSHGDRVNLNQFEEDIVKLLNLLDYNNIKIDWKIHHNIFDDSNNIMNSQKLYIEKEFDIKLSFIDHKIKSSSIMKNYNLVIFTTYTTGIYEAALLDVPFIIYSNDNEECNGVNLTSIPIAKNDQEFKKLLISNKSDYLHIIRNSLIENITLDKYLINKCA